MKALLSSTQLVSVIFCFFELQSGCFVCQTGRSDLVTVFCKCMLRIRLLNVCVLLGISRGVGTGEKEECRYVSMMTYRSSMEVAKSPGYALVFGKH